MASTKKERKAAPAEVRKKGSRKSSPALSRREIGERVRLPVGSEGIYLLTRRVLRPSSRYVLKEMYE